MKPWYQSVTIWTNIGAFTAALAPIISTQLGDAIGVDRALQVSAVFGMANMVLQLFIRYFITSSGIQRGSV